MHMLNAAGWLLVIAVAVAAIVLTIVEMEQ